MLQSKSLDTSENSRSKEFLNVVTKGDYVNIRRIQIGVSPEF